MPEQLPITTAVASASSSWWTSRRMEPTLGEYRARFSFSLKNESLVLVLVSQLK